MTEQEAFHHIDKAIETLTKEKAFHKHIKVSTEAKSDWLTFNWRQLTWTKNDVHYLIEIYPNFDQRETITGWNMYAAAYFDLDKKRYYVSKTVTENQTIDIIAGNAFSLLTECYKYLTDLKKADIPFAVSLH